jgi:dissimilatory sulfite reductase (desulfoviridin) alpha/beta subunit
MESKLHESESNFLKQVDCDFFIRIKPSGNYHLIMDFIATFPQIVQKIGDTLGRRTSRVYVGNL